MLSRLPVTSIDLHSLSCIIEGILIIFVSLMTDLVMINTLNTKCNENLRIF